MKHRKLRIAWSVTCGVAALLLVPLWVRSYGTVDAVYIAHTHNAVLMRGDAYIDAAVSAPASLGPTTRNFGSLVTLSTWTLGKGLNIAEHRLVIPVWVLMLLPATCGAIPWFVDRFSLRTLLIATTLVAVGLGVTAWAAH
jgi:hypothetical protein